jgi:hypothetical protein
LLHSQSAATLQFCKTDKTQSKQSQEFRDVCVRNWFESNDVLDGKHKSINISILDR